MTGSASMLKLTTLAGGEKGLPFSAVGVEKGFEPAVPVRGVEVPDTLLRLLWLR
jgi:hypothetical protein